MDFNMVHLLSNWGLPVGGPQPNHTRPRRLLLAGGQQNQNGITPQALRENPETRANGHPGFCWLTTSRIDLVI